MKLSKREKQMLRDADVHQRIKYNQHKADEPCKNWSKSRRASHDSFCHAMNIQSQ